MAKIQKIEKTVKTAIKRKSAYSLPNNPIEGGYSADDIRKAFYTPIIDDDNSVVSELERVIDEANKAFVENDSALDENDTKFGEINETLEALSTGKLDKPSANPLEDSVVVINALGEVFYKALKEFVGYVTGVTYDLKEHAFTVTFANGETKKIQLESKVSQFENDAGYLTDALNIYNGTGVGSLAQRGNDFVSASYSAVFGFNNGTVEGTRNLVVGYSNKLLSGTVNGKAASPENNFVSGRANKVFPTKSSICVGYRCSIGFKLTNNEKNISDEQLTSSINDCIVQGTYSAALHSFAHLLGVGLKTGRTYQVAVGVGNVGKANTAFEVGIGTYSPETETVNSRINGFEVLRDGRAKVLSPPKDSNDVVRLGDIGNLSGKYKHDVEITPANAQLTGYIILSTISDSSTRITNYSSFVSVFGLESEYTLPVVNGFLHNTETKANYIVQSVSCSIDGGEEKFTMTAYNLSTGALQTLYLWVSNSASDNFYDYVTSA